ncbi:MAG TPA: hypothetical protein PKD54_01910 [Pirellulaceae bacterium]|nr:hypothetical protein [Pirellulaceae bacterium]
MKQPDNRDVRVLVTGEFWHADFADLLNGIDVPATFVRLDKLVSLQTLPERYTAVIVAQSRRNSISQEAIDQIHRLLPDTPQVAILGSWCEGEQRSGTPLQNIARVYWHQWQGEFDQLADCLQVSLNRPLAEIPARIRRDSERQRSKQAEPHQLPPQRPTVGVSACTLTQYEMVADGLAGIQCDALWLERTAWDGVEPRSLTAMILDSDSLTENLTNRLVFLRNMAPECPVVLLMSFPRIDEVSALRSTWNVDAVVSKPFDLRSLYYALRQTGVRLCCAPPAAKSEPPMITPPVDPRVSSETPQIG